jgi:hypothetical protein
MLGMRHCDERTMTLEDIIQDRIDKSTSLDDLAVTLKNLLTNNSVWDDGTLLEIKALFDCFGGLRIEVYHTEHPPPHFHVKAQNIDAAFSIKDCALLSGSIGGRERRMVSGGLRGPR